MKLITEMTEDIQLLAELNEKEAAVAAAKVSLKLADEAGNKDYVRLNTKAIEEWSK